MKNDTQVSERSVEDLASLVFDDLSEAERSLPKPDRDAYREAQQSVVDARRRAETTEGLLRIS